MGEDAGLSLDVRKYGRGRFETDRHAAAHSKHSGRACDLAYGPLPHRRTLLQQQFDRMKQAAQFRVLRARAFVDHFTQTVEKTRGRRTGRRTAA